MELSWLKSFVCIGREGNLTRAANALFISQSALSAQLKALEEELGLPLFERLPKGMRLTRAGETLMVQAEDIIDAASRMKRSAEQLKGDVSGSIRIALNSDPRFLRMTATSEAIGARFPKLSVYFVTTSSWLVPKSLRADEYDIAFLFGTVNEPGITSECIGDVNLRVVAPAGYADAVEGASWEDLISLPWVLPSAHCAYFANLSAWTVKHGLPDISVERKLVADDEYMVNELVKAGQGLAVMRDDDAERLIEAGVAVGWEHPPISAPLCLAWLTRRADEPALKGVREMIVSMWAGDAAERVS